MMDLAVDAVIDENDLDFLHGCLQEDALGVNGPPLSREACRKSLNARDVVHGIAREKATSTRVGFVRIDLAVTDAELTIFVERAFRGCGMGGQLISWAAKRAGQRGLFAWTAVGNTAARALFSTNGFCCPGENLAGLVRWEKESS